MVFKIETDLMMFCLGRADEQALVKAEEEIGHKLPEKFKKMVLLCDGGYPEKNVFIFFDPFMDEYTMGNFGGLLSFDKGCSSEKFLEYYREPSEFFPDKVIAFGIDGGGNALCFDYRKQDIADNPPVVYWDHERPPEESLSVVSESFDSFLALLTTEEEGMAEWTRLNAELKKSGE